MDNKPQRPRLGRACKKLEEAGETGVLKGDDPLDLNPKLWRKLPVEQAYNVLSFLPVDRLVDTLRVVNRKWEKFLRCDNFSHIFGHGSNLVSSYGFVTLPNRNVPRLLAFEHESMQWREFPKRLQADVKQSRVTSGGSDGLLLCESKKCRMTNLPFSKIYHESMDDEVHYPDIGVWNPLLRTLKWLPEHPKLTTERSYREFCTTQYSVMVDEPSRTYKVFLRYTSQRTLRWVYSVYSSTSESWSACKLMPKFENFSSSMRTATCERYIFFDGNGYRDNYIPGQGSIRKEYLCWYDVQRDSWDTVFLCKILTDLGYSPESGSFESAQIGSFAIRHGLLYMIIRTCTYPEVTDGTDKVQFTLASLDLSTLDCEFGAATPTFKLETVVPSTRFPMSTFLEVSFNLYTYTMKGKGYLCVRTSPSGHFLHFDVSCGDWLEHDKFPELGYRNWEDGRDCFSFKPSLVVP